MTRGSTFHHFMLCTAVLVSLLGIFFDPSLGKDVSSPSCTKSGSSWQTTLFPDWTGILQPGQAASVLVGVTVPSGAQLGDRDSVTVRVTSRVDPSVQRMITLTTVYGEVTFLPILLK